MTGDLMGSETRRATVPVPERPGRPGRFLGLPATLAGRWALGLAGGFACCFALSSLGVALGWWVWGDGPPLLLNLLAAVSALAGVPVAAFALIVRRERSALLLLPLLPAALVVAFLAGEFFATGDRAADERSMENYDAPGRPVPVPVLVAPGQPLAEVEAIAAGQVHALALRRDGTVWAWGGNRFGQRGDGTTASWGVGAPVTADWGVPAPVLVAPGQPLAGVTAVAARLNHSLALTRDGVVWAWGENNHGVLGDGTTERRATPVRVAVPIPVRAVATGSFFSLALGQDGSVWAWGDNRRGQLGDGTTTERRTPAPVAGLAGIVALAAGNEHALALAADGAIWTWGGDAAASGPVPTRVAGLAGVTALAAGRGSSFAVTADGALWAWGANGEGELADGTTAARPAPARVAGLPAVAAVAPSYHGMSAGHTLAIARDGTVWAWGINGQGQLGDGTIAPPPQRGMPLVASPPAPVLLRPDRPLAGMASVAAANGGSLALGQDGTVWAWGAYIAGAGGGR